jgi:hypothetical protein
VLDDRTDFDGGGVRPAVIEPDGTLRPARLTPLWAGRFPSQECGPKVVRSTVDNGSAERRGLVRVGVQPPAHAAQIPVIAGYGDAPAAPLGPIRLAAGAETGGIAAEMEGLRTLELHLPEGVCVQALTTMLAD